MITLQNITKQTINKTLFEGINLNLSRRQKVGLVGPNGSGKTTLMRLILNQEEPDSGRVLVNKEKLGYLSQEIQPQDVSVDEFLSLSKASKATKKEAVLESVGLSDLSMNSQVENLSGGQKVRLGLARLLLERPTTLLLDEPTNNLDLPSLVWLENFINSFPGKVLIISHDRYLLDHCVDKIIEIEPRQGKINEFGGNYSQYRRQKESQENSQLAAYKVQQNQEKKMRQWIADKQQQLQHHPNNKVASQLQSMKKRLQREILSQQLDKPQAESAFMVTKLGESLPASKYVFGFRNFEIEGLLRCELLDLFAGDRALLVGPNGSGKTTLIRSMLSLNSNYRGQIEVGPQLNCGYFSQEHEVLLKEKTVLENFKQLIPGMTESKARHLLGSFIFSQHDVFKKVNQLSQGERARLHIAILVNQHNNFLILDEPTNHLDIPSREVLEKALRAYRGGFLVVSHDRFFVKQIAINRVLKIYQQELWDVTSQLTPTKN